VSLPIHQFHQQSRHKYSLSFENWLPLAEKIKNLPCHGIRRKLKLWYIFDSGSFEYFLHLNFDRPAVENSRFDEIAGLWFWKSFWLLGTKLILRTNFCYNEVLRRLTNDGRANNRNIETPYKKILIMSFKITTQHVTINNIPNKRSWNIVFLVCWAMNECERSRYELAIFDQALKHRRARLKLIWNVTRTEEKNAEKSKCIAIKLRYKYSKGIS